MSLGLGVHGATEFPYEQTVDAHGLVVTVKFPTLPEYREKERKTFVGTVVTDEWDSDLDGASFALTDSDLPWAAHALATDRTLYKKAAEKMIALIGGQLEVVAKGGPGAFEQVVRFHIDRVGAPPLHGRALFALRRDRMIVVVAYGPDSAAALMDEFFARVESRAL